MNEEDLLEPEAKPIQTHFFSPKNLKRFIFGGILLIIFLITSIYIVIKVLDRRPPDALFWYDKLKQIKFTSYENQNYGTFFCSVKINLAYQDEDLKEEIEEKKNQIINTIRKTISEQNYYKINNDIKLQHNLTPVLKSNINRLIIKRNGIKDITYPFIRLIINRNTTSNMFSHLNLGTFNIKLDNEKYQSQIYIVYDPSSTLFNKHIEKNKSNITKLILSYINKQNIEAISFQERINPMLNKELEEYFGDMEARIKRKEPFYNITGNFKNVFFAYLIPLPNT